MSRLFYKRSLRDELARYADTRVWTVCSALAFAKGRLAPIVLALACAVSLPRPAHGADNGGAEAVGPPVEAKATPPPELTERQAEAEAVRELKFKKAPAYKALKRDEILPFLKKEVLEQYDEGELENLLWAYEKLGLIKSADGLAERLVEAYARAVMAFYNEKTHTVYLIEDLPAPAVMRKIAELHELIHALQDQHFDLSSLPLKETHCTDRANAAMALVEGDATLATFDYAIEHARLALADVLQIAFGTEQLAPAMPYLFRREMRFVYFDGLKLARALHAKGGWEALNEAFADPPASTEQVLHYKEKYLEERDEPTPVELPDCTPVLGEGWKLVAEDTLGELGTQVLFRQHLSFVRAGKPSRGWDGDRLHLYRSDEGEGEAFVLIWRSVWDTEKDAQEFGHAYRKVLVRKLRPRPEGVAHNELGLVLSGERGVAILRIERVGALIVEAPSARVARAVARHLLAGDDKKGQRTAEEESAR